MKSIFLASRQGKAREKRQRHFFLGIERKEFLRTRTTTMNNVLVRPIVMECEGRREGGAGRAAGRSRYKYVLKIL